MRYTCFWNYFFSYNSPSFKGNCKKLFFWPVTKVSTWSLFLALWPQVKCSCWFLWLFCKCCHPWCMPSWHSKYHSGALLINAGVKQLLIYSKEFIIFEMFSLYKMLDESWDIMKPWRYHAGLEQRPFTVSTLSWQKPESDHSKQNAVNGGQLSSAASTFCLSSLEYNLSPET